MPKQSRVKKQPMRKIDDLLTDVFARLCKLETGAVELSESIDAVDERIDVTHGAALEVESRCKQLQERMNSDFDDQDDEIEKISRRLQSVEDKLKAKQIGEETNVTLTARVKELQRQLTDANETIRRMQDQELAFGHSMANERNAWTAELQKIRAERDAEIVRADRVQRQLNEANTRIEELKFKIPASDRPRRMWFSKS